MRPRPEALRRPAAGRLRQVVRRAAVGRWLVAAAFGLAGSIGMRADEPVSFRNDVLPVLSKAGCNGGGCHGALAGKGGFRLSLFAYDPESDHRAITREALGRRVEPTDPARSLLLTKATTAVRHQGGRRLETGSADYDLLVRWIAQGAPGPSDDDAVVTGLEVRTGSDTPRIGSDIPLSVHARFSDGSERDVTRWARFTSVDETVASVDGSGRVTVSGPGAGAVTAWYSSRIAIARITVPHEAPVPADAFDSAPQAGFIDRLVLAQLRRLNLEPSPPADDATFVRRAHLDAIGRLPTPEEARAYVEDPSPDKVARLADRLLAHPGFVDYWAYRWSDVLLVNGSRLRPAAVKAYHGWIRDRVADNTPWDELVRRLVTSVGSSTEDGASNFFAVHQDPESMAENVSQAFLGLSINCARCHNHPLEKWTNDQYYQFANLFARVRAKGWGGDARSGDGRRTLYDAPWGDLIQPRTGRPQPPAPLDAPPIAADDPRERREVLADWLTDPANPCFARAVANRVWAAYLGVGLVESVDDLRVSNPASNEPLLAALADHLVGSGFDLKSLMRAILNSETYRRSAEVRPGNRDDRRHYSRHFPRRLPAEVLSDAIADVTGVRDRYTEIALNDGSSEKTGEYGRGTRALQLADSAVKSYFLSTFGRNQREITCECERSNQPSLVQVLHLTNGNGINAKLADTDGRVAAWIREGRSDAGIVDAAWWLSLSRGPTDAERAGAMEALRGLDGDRRREAVEDLMWSLLTSREFLFQH